MSEQEMKNDSEKWNLKTWMLAIAASAIISVLLIFLTNTNSQKNKLSIELSQIKSTIGENIDSCKKESEKIKAKNIALIKKLETLEEPDATLEKDIKDYIESKYSLVPSIVAADIAKNVVKYSKEGNISPELVLGIIEVESSFNPMAISSKKARGLMQLMAEWAKKFGIEKVTDFHDIDTNIKYGIEVLKIHIDEDGKGNVTKGLYYYVGKSDTYADKVYIAIGKFVSFRYKNNSDDEVVEVSEQTEVKKIETVNGTTNNS